MTYPKHSRTEPGSSSVNGTRNRILGALPVEEYKRFAPHLTRVDLVIRDLLFDVNQPITHVYFPESCVASLVGMMADGSAVETATVGDEGMIGMPLFHGTDRTASQAFCQIEGVALRLPAQVFCDGLVGAPTLTRMLHLYSQALFTLIAQSSACNRLHTMQHRCARWLLLCHDRVGADGASQFPLTQSFLSQMLGVRRATVTDAMGALQESGSISYEMGQITVLDRGRLEQASCECYAIVRSEFDRLLPRISGATFANPLDELKTSEDGKSMAGDAVPEMDRKDVGIG